jgi:hypothetical protein
MAYFIDGVQYTKTEYYIKLEEVKAHVTLINDYVSKVQSGEITLEEVPQEYYQEVYDILNPPPVPEEPDPRQSLIDEIIAEVNA